MTTCQYSALSGQKSSHLAMLRDWPRWVGQRGIIYSHPTYYVLKHCILGEKLKLKFKFYTVLDDIDKLTTTTSSLPMEETTKLYFNGLQYKATKHNMDKEYDHI